MYLVAGVGATSGGLFASLADAIGGSRFMDPARSLMNSNAGTQARMSSMPVAVRAAAAPLATALPTAALPSPPDFAGFDAFVGVALPGADGLAPQPPSTAVLAPQDWPQMCADTCTEFVDHSTAPPTSCLGFTYFSGTHPVEGLRHRCVIMRSDQNAVWTTAPVAPAEAQYVISGHNTMPAPVASARPPLPSLRGGAAAAPRSSAPLAAGTEKRTTDGFEFWSPRRHVTSNDLLRGGEGAPQIQSSHTCFGKSHEAQAWQHGTCEYTNICYSEKGRPSGHGRWFYFATDAEEREHLIRTNALAVALAPAPMSVNERSFWSPEIFTQAEATDVLGAAGLNLASISFVQPVHVFYMSFNAENFGHYLTDELLPIYAMLEAFDELDVEEGARPGESGVAGAGKNLGRAGTDVRLVRFVPNPPIGNSCEHLARAAGGSGTASGDKVLRLCNKFHTTLGPMMSRHLTLTLGDALVQLAAAADAKDAAATVGAAAHVASGSGRGFCFRKVIAGMGYLADHCQDSGSHGARGPWSTECNNGRSGQFWRFRNYAMRNLGVVPTLQPLRHHVVAWERTGGGRNDGARSIDRSALSTLGDAIRERSGVVVTLYQFHKFPIREQLEMIRSATVFVTPVGAGSHVALFLPRGATMVRLYRGNFKLEWHLFNFMAYAHTDHVSCPRGAIPIEEVCGLVVEGVRRYDAYRAERSDAKSFTPHAGAAPAVPVATAVGAPPGALAAPRGLVAAAAANAVRSLPLLRDSLSASVEVQRAAPRATVGAQKASAVRALPALNIAGAGGPVIEAFPNLCVKAKGLKWGAEALGGDIVIAKTIPNLRSVRITRVSGKLSCHSSMGTNFGASDFGCNVSSAALRTESTVGLLLTKDSCHSQDATIVLPTVENVEGFVPLMTHSPFYMLESCVAIPLSLALALALALALSSPLRAVAPAPLTHSRSRSRSTE
jgi:hypothetical protein